MPGIILSPSASSLGPTAGMKRAHEAQPASAFAEPHRKKRRIVHHIHHAQPVHHIVEPINPEMTDSGDCKDFFDQQLRRAIAVQCRGTGFDSTRPDALEEFRGLVDSYMIKFLTQVRKSMLNARRTDTVAHDWIYALSSVGLQSSASLERHLDIGDIPPSLLQPHLAPPVPPEPSPPDTESLLGTELSGKADKETRLYIPPHFPSFPSKHTYKATPVYTNRENDPRMIREKATEEGIFAEQSLRKLMAAQKAGVQKQHVGKRKRSIRMRHSDKLWLDAMQDLLREEKSREQDEEQKRAREAAEEAEEESAWDAPLEARSQRPAPIDRSVNLEEGVHVNYEQRFWRKSARGV